MRHFIWPRPTGIWPNSGTLSSAPYPALASSADASSLSRLTVTSFSEARICQSGLLRANSAAKAQRSMWYFAEAEGADAVLLVVMRTTEADAEDVVRHLTRAAVRRGA